MSQYFSTKLVIFDHFTIQLISRLQRLYQTLCDDNILILK
jgi:hypothetical protein